MHAWFAGDFERCVRSCEGVRYGDAETRCRVGLLKARALLHLERPADALAALAEIAVLATTGDDALTHRMLTGAAQLQSGQTDVALAVLLAAHRDAVRAHAAIRSEIALYIGFANVIRGNWDVAERAFEAVTKNADLISVRATQQRGWIAFARGALERAARLFTDALNALDQCAQYDPTVEADCTRALAQIALERLDPRIWTVVERRRATIDWSSTSVAYQRFSIAYWGAAFRLDVDGSQLEAAREARLAERIAPSEAFRVQAICKRASILRCSAEVHGHIDHLESACEMLASLNVGNFAGDERFVPLVVAEELASADSAEARAVFDRYCGLAAITSTEQHATTMLLETYREFVEATIYDCCGDRREAIQRYRKVLRKFRDGGSVRRAVIVALRLVKLTGDRKALDYADAATVHLPPHSWIRAEIEARKAPVLRLTPLQREVLALICEGRSNPEIAQARNRSLHTVRNMVARLFEIFEVSGREQLVVACVRRGIYPAI